MELSELPNEEFKEHFRYWLIEQSPKNFKTLSGYEILKSYIIFRYGDEIVFDRKDFQFFVSFKREIIDEIKVWLETFELNFEDFKIYFELFSEDFLLENEPSFDAIFLEFISYIKAEGLVINKSEINRPILIQIYKKVIKNSKLKKSIEEQLIDKDNLALKRREYKREYKKLNPEKTSKQKMKYKRDRMKRDMTFKILHRLRTRILLVLHGKKKAESSMNLLGCTAEHLKKHLEEQFKDDMSWENYGIRGWHIDHIKPCASFDLSIIEEQKECFHYTNLQPLWWFDNLAKSDKII